MTLSGGCECGAVRFTAEGEPYRAGICHCMTCRKLSGSLFNAFVVYPAASVRVTGATAVHPSSELGRRHFCPGCGSQVFARDEGSDEIELRIGGFDEPNRFRPTYEGFVGRREAWLPAFDGFRRYAGNREEPGRGG